MVLDPFAGTGTTCVAAQMEGMRSVGIDIDPSYLVVASGRLGLDGQIVVTEGGSATGLHGAVDQE